VPHWKPGSALDIALHLATIRPSFTVRTKFLMAESRRVGAPDGRRRLGMDGDQFDRLTRVMATGLSRRRVLQGVTSSISAVWIAQSKPEVSLAAPTCRETGSRCGNGRRCCSGVCVDHACAAPTCSDGVRNGSETDVDCGGGTCPTCAVGSACAGNLDCTSGYCVNGNCEPCPSTSICHGECLVDRNTSNDPDHCGSCDIVCLGTHVTVRRCIASVCAPVCEDGWSTCDENPTNGCETFGPCA
jgi:hypothetical protein